MVTFGSPTVALLPRFAKLWMVVIVADSLQPFVRATFTVMLFLTADVRHRIRQLTGPEGEDTISPLPGKFLPVTYLFAGPVAARAF